MEPGHIKAAVEIWYEASVAAHNFIPAEYWKENRDAMANTYLPASEAYVAIADGAMQGFIAMVGNHLAAVFVAVKMQGRGVGKALLQFVKDKRNVIQLKAYQKNTKTVQFYLNQGFRIISEQQEAGTSACEYVMEWQAPH